MSTQTIKIFDTTLRDGEQSPGASMNTEEKIQIAAQLERLGVDVIEAGFAAASPGDFDAIDKIAQRVPKMEPAIFQDKPVEFSFKVPVVITTNETE